uniref:Uncharacterized protein n=1 Tax=Chromera velia CCMP2878 TaxID=1169474 RepID=A0A0G4HTU0_9ALVE|eukprot:Cvel_8513.t1-p1 / transcript=Cvel_8513.t1 / gene=Cvel_8513 / organism=Chromera_velia_CCMP2878 / gene_product=Putative hydrolase RBBP9, putative / transcript_product=Putative hydrolase RBBP9, putative / location=Cvel_scaffold471:43182-44645(+) / protein_length=328 / sequence_SO=supercontig / SO=protein_coding / is_pseudo=false
MKRDSRKPVQKRVSQLTDGGQGASPRFFQRSLRQVEPLISFATIRFCTVLCIAVCTGSFLQIARSRSDQRSLSEAFRSSRRSPSSVFPVGFLRNPTKGGGRSEWGRPSSCVSKGGGEEKAWRGRRQRLAIDCEATGGDTPGEKMEKPTKAIIIPGNGCGDDLSDCMWYPWLAQKFKSEGIECDLRGFPDPLYARESIWKPFAVETLGLDERTILVGHSSGAACSLRLVEEHKVAGCVLVSAYHDDLGDEIEAGSGYFNRPFEWEKMRFNAGWIIQFHSKDDHLVPVGVAREVASLLKPSEYVEQTEDGHFQDDEYEECMWERIKNRLK